MRFEKKYTLFAIILTIIIIGNNLFACDDTLVMLLTAKNPTSEFSKSIRAFMNSLTVLGTALKYTTKDDYSNEIEGTLNAWMEFSKKYMTNPPEEAKNDRFWVEKMASTARKIGEIRKLVNIKRYSEGHNKVLELSNTIGTFFEAVGISDEKQVFLTASADLNDLQRFIDNKSKNEADEKLKKLKQDLESFSKYLTEDDALITSNTANIITSISKDLFDNKPFIEIDKKVSKLKTSFEELRSRILMQEWFADEEAEKENN